MFKKLRQNKTIRVITIVASIISIAAFVFDRFNTEQAITPPAAVPHTGGSDINAVKDDYHIFAKRIKPQSDVLKAKFVENGLRGRDKDGILNRFILECIRVDEDVVIMFDAKAKGKGLPLTRRTAKSCRLGIRVSLNDTILEEKYVDYKENTGNGFFATVGFQLMLKPGIYCFEVLGIYADTIVNDYMSFNYTVFRIPESPVKYKTQGVFIDG